MLTEEENIHCGKYNWGFSGSSDGKESTYNAGHLGSIPG